MQRTKSLFLGFLICTAAILPAERARADDLSRLTVVEENDALTQSGDKHYTQGLRVSRLSQALAGNDGWAAPFLWLGENTPIFQGGEIERRYDWQLLGQSIFTPQNIHTANPSATDRPYGAWLYTGASLLQETKGKANDMLENAELELGVVGPLALGRQVQDDWHQFIGIAPAEGWRNQLHNEPGLVLSYERKWRFEKPLNDNLSVDAIPEAGGTLGNVFTYGEAGGMVRFGHNLEADYGSNHIRPSLSGTGWFDAKRMKDPLGWYLFAGMQGRLIGRNVFLDGNTWRDSASVDKKPVVADFTGGASVFWANNVRLDFTVTERSREFYGQQNWDRFGSVGLTVGF